MSVQLPELPQNTASRAPEVPSVSATDERPGVKVFGHFISRRAIELCIFFLVMFVAFELIFGRVCIIQILTGYPCPGCGLLHAAWYVLTLQFERAFLSNPTIVLWIPMTLYFLWRAWKGKLRSKSLAILLVITCIITLVVYVYRMITIFPDYPMNFYSQNLIARFVSLFQ